MLLSVDAKPRKSWLLAASALTSSLLGMTGPAQADNECGPLVGGSATCLPAGNPYPTGINYDTEDGLGGSPINLSILSGVNIVIPAGAGGVNTINAANTAGVTSGSANITITADGVTIDNTANPANDNNTGLRIQSSGDAIITATNTTIGVSGTASEDGIVAFAMPNLTGASHVASVTWSGGNITSNGPEATGIQADNRGIGNATIAASGNITGTPNVGQADFFGLIAHAGDSLLVSSGAGDASVTYSSGTINAFGNAPRGIVAWVEGDGSASVTTAAGTIITITGSDNPGVDPPTLPVASAIALELDSATAAAGRALTADVASQISNIGAPTPGVFFRNPTGIRALAFADAPITVNYTGTGITTQGGGGAGIMALSDSGSVNVNSSGPIDTSGGFNAVGILADSGSVVAKNSGTATDVLKIHAPVPAVPATGAVQVTAINVTSNGEFGTGIDATAGNGGVTVNIASGGSVMGGWQTDPAGVGSAYGTPSVGVIFGSSGDATLNNAGTIGALSDRAVVTSDLYPGADPVINNTGTIDGFVKLGAGTNTFMNDGIVNQRDFEDTDGDGVRDTVRVAVSDLGSGPANTFSNGGTVALPGSPSATTLDNTGQYLPLGNTNNAMAIGGPTQGQILGVATFDNSGTIDLQANPVPGDVLLISGGHTPGTSGGGTFKSNGGRLLLDTVLNEGGPASRSDVLVVDGTAVGDGGATRLFVKNAGGAGALTVGDGILVTQVLDAGRSANDAFVLGNDVAAGPYEYKLFPGGVGADAGDGNWYLRSSLNCTLAPAAPECQTPPTGVPPRPPTEEVVPIFRPAAALYAKVPLIGRQVALLTLGTFHERQGDQMLLDPSLTGPGTGANVNPAQLDELSLGPLWGRVFGEQLKQSWTGLLSPQFEGHIAAVQVGLDVYRFQSAEGQSDHIGLFYAFSGSAGTGHGFVLGLQNSLDGHLSLQTHNIGGYWSHIGAGGWYADAVLMGTFYRAFPSHTPQDVAADLSGTGITASLEGGYPIAIAEDWEFEPQAQIIWQSIDFGHAADPFTTLDFHLDDSFTGRLGFQIQDNLIVDGMGIQPRLLFNYWHNFGGTDTTVYNAIIPLTTDFGADAIEVGAGIAAHLSDKIGGYAQVSYTTNVGGDYRQDIMGTIGFRFDL
jgi:outer membrane autotransporter protein